MKYIRLWINPDPTMEDRCPKCGRTYFLFPPICACGYKFHMDISMKTLSIILIILIILIGLLMGSLLMR